MASRLDGSVGSEACRVVGLFETFDSGFDQSHVYIPCRLHGKCSARKAESPEFVVNPVDTKHTDAIAALLKSALPGGYEVLTYKQMLPLLVMQLQLYYETIYIFYESLPSL